MKGKQTEQHLNTVNTTEKVTREITIKSKSRQHNEKVTIMLVSRKWASKLCLEMNNSVQTGDQECTGSLLLSFAAFKKKEFSLCLHRLTCNDFQPVSSAKALKPGCIKALSLDTVPAKDNCSVRVIFLNLSVTQRKK